MRIEDLEAINQDLPYNLVDDIAIYMRNDPTFYRQVFFPAVQKMKEMHHKGEKYNPDAELGPMIKKAATNYCKKFNIPRLPEELVSEDEYRDLVKKIYSEELTNIKKDVY
jgi:hypothetical protein